MKIICPLPKSPHSSGRVGKVECQDWYKTVVRSVQLYKGGSVDTKVVIVTNFHAQGDSPEQDIYRKALNINGVSDTSIISVERGNETIGQLMAIEALQKECGAEVTIVSTWLHYPRVRWLSRGKQYKHKVAWGIPRPKEVVTDIILNFLFPAIDLLGFRDWFLRKVSTRRDAGTV